MRIVRSITWRIKAYSSQGWYKNLLLAIAYHFILISLSTILLFGCFCSWAPPEPRNGRFACPTVPHMFMLFKCHVREHIEHLVECDLVKESLLKLIGVSNEIDEVGPKQAKWQNAQFWHSRECGKGVRVTATHGKFLVAY